MARNRKDEEDWPEELEGFALHEQARPAEIPDSPPDARILALDIGLYGHVGGMTSMFWWQTGGILAAHETMLFQTDDSLTYQLAVLEQWAEEFPEYREGLPPIVIIGTTVLSSYARQTVRASLDRWVSPPWLRRMVNVGEDYAGEQSGNRSRISRKALRDLLAVHMSDGRLRLTDDQRAAVALYTGKRERPRRDPDSDEWRVDETDAISLPVAYACYAARYMLPAPEESWEQTEERLEQWAHAWQIVLPGLSDDDALERAWTQGHPDDISRPEALNDDGDDLIRPIGVTPSWRNDL